MQRIKFLNILSVIATVFMTVAIVACGPGNGKCSVEGHFLKMNQGQFYVYSPDGVIAGIDTINAMGGRFDYECECKDEGIIVLVFPNYSELPIFIESGASISIEADATHIKDIEVTGTDENEEMNKWRKENKDLSNSQMATNAEKFIKENPSSLVSQWLLYKYLISDAKTPRNKILKLVELMQQSSEKSVSLARMNTILKTTSSAQVGEKLPKFNATDIYGKNVSSSDYMTGNVIITVWATWNYDGQNMNRRIRSKLDDSQISVKPKVLSICLDPSVEETKSTLSRDTLPWHVISDGKMFESPIVKALGISSIPDNIIVKNGKIVARHLKTDEAVEKACQ